MLTIVNDNYFTSNSISGDKQRPETGYEWAQRQLEFPPAQFCWISKSWPSVLSLNGEMQSQIRQVCT